MLPVFTSVSGQIVKLGRLSTIDALVHVIGQSVGACGMDGALQQRRLIQCRPWSVEMLRSAVVAVHSRSLYVVQTVTLDTTPNGVIPDQLCVNARVLLRHHGRSAAIIVLDTVGTRNFAFPFE